MKDHISDWYVKTCYEMIMEGAMSNRNLLLSAFVGLSLVAIAMVSFTFIATLQPNAKAINERQVIIKLDELKTGEVIIKEFAGNRLFFLRPNSDQLKAIEDLDDHVWDTSLSNYDPTLDAYVYWGHSTKRGCGLDHKPPNDSALKHYREKANWLGGYWDLICEVSYDYAGRAIKTYEYTFNGFTGEFPNLHKPNLEQISKTDFVVSLY